MSRGESDGHEATGPGMDGEQLRAMMQEHHLASFGWARACGSRLGVEAEDVLQAVYLKILAGQARFDGRSTFRTWIFAVIRTTALDERRRRWLRLRFFPAAPAGAEQPDHADRAAGPGEIAERSEESAAFREALAHLPGRQQEALHLVFYQDLTIEEAAGVMGVSVGSARTHYDRGKQRLRMLLRGREDGHGQG